MSLKVPTSKAIRLPQQRWGSLVFLMACVGAIFLLALGFYWGAGAFALLNFDDQLHLTGNPFIQPDSPDRFSRFWLDEYGKLYVPITYNLWAIVYARCFDPQTGLFSPVLLHRLNVLTHAANGGLVFLLLRSLLRSTCEVAGRPLARSRLLLTAGAFLGASLFVLHPLQVEAVAWISEFRGLLAALFGISAWLVHVYAIEARSRRMRITLEAIATLAFTAALLSKPSAAAIPLMVAATDFLLSRLTLKQIASTLGAWFVLTLACLVAMRFLQSGGTTYAGPLWGRPMIALDSLSFYLSKLVWPMDLGADYSRTPRFVLGRLGDLSSIWAWIIPIWLVALLSWRRHRVMMTCASVFGLALSPVLGLVPFEFQRLSTVADRYAYLAMIGPALLLGWIVNRWPRTGVLALIGLVFLAFASHAQLATWRSDSSLWTHAARVNPNAVSARLNLAAAAGDRGDHERSRRLFQQAIELDPARMNGYVGLGSLSLKSGDPVAALREFDRAAQAEPGLAEPHLQAAVALQTLGRADECERRFGRALELEPDSVSARVGIARIELDRGQPAQAESRLDQALAIHPRDVEAWMLKASARLALGDSRGYIDAMNKAVRFAGTDPTPLDELGKFAVSIQDWPAATDCFERSLKLVPDRVPILVELGTAQARSGDARAAIRTLEHALRLAPDSPIILNNLRSAKILLERQSSAPATKQN